MPQWLTVLVASVFGYGLLVTGCCQLAKRVSIPAYEEESWFDVPIVAIESRACNGIAIIEPIAHGTSIEAAVLARN